MRELLISLQKQAAEMEFKASVLVQEIGLALDRLEPREGGCNRCRAAAWEPCRCPTEDTKSERLAELNEGLASVGLVVR